jgi:tRNA nucleotidyltransferase/poly(A) polymerase
MPEIFEVGGCIRDGILGIDSKDIDFTFVLDDKSHSVEVGFEYMTNWLEDHGFKIFLSTPEMFTICAKFPKDHVHAGLVADFVMARKEVGRIEGTRRQSLELGSLEDDLRRRDFTMNAIARAEDGTIIDPFNGIQSIKNRTMDTPLDPMITFMDDPLRMIRALRFRITKGFGITERIAEAMKQQELLERLKETVSKERIREELKKMFDHDTVKTMRILHRMDEEFLPGFLDVIFEGGMRLEPTFKKAKRKQSTTE